MNPIVIIFNQQGQLIRILKDHGYMFTTNDIVVYGMLYRIKSKVHEGSITCVTIC